MAETKQGKNKFLEKTLAIFIHMCYTAYKKMKVRAVYGGRREDVGPSPALHMCSGTYTIAFATPECIIPHRLQPLQEGRSYAV